MTALAVFACSRDWALSEETETGPEHSEMRSQNSSRFKNLLPSKLGDHGQRQSTLCSSLGAFWKPPLPLESFSCFGWMFLTTFEGDLPEKCWIQSSSSLDMKQSSFHHSPTYYLCLQDVLSQVARNLPVIYKRRKGIK